MGSLVACMVAVAVSLAGCGPSPQPSGLPDESAPASPEATVAAFDPGWRHVELGVPPDTNLTSAYAGPSGLVILGGRFGPAGFIGATWTSADGTLWRMQATPGFMAPSAGAAIGNVEVLLGAGETNRCAHPAGETTWARRDGGDWSAAPFQQSLFCAGGGPELAAGDGSFVIAGSGTGDQPFAWWSIDGLLWRDIPIPVDPFVIVRGLVWDDGMFWIIGRGEGGIVARTSPDGQKWSGWLTLIGRPGIDPLAVAPLDGTPILFTKDAGRDDVWQLTGPDTAVVVRPSGLEALRGNVAQAVAAAAGRLYVTLDTPQGSRLVTSLEGMSWSEVALPPLRGLRITGIADDGSHVLIVGAIEADATTWGAWLGTSPPGP
ncbi:MAG: hypothetical protein HYX57_00020 [Chloroflexi bacterium]|nr:hypothetical protein [Chloroflexota bacterium]